MEIEYLGKNSFNEILNLLQYLTRLNRWDDITENSVYIGYKVNPLFDLNDAESDVLIPDENSISILVLPPNEPENLVYYSSWHSILHAKIVIFPKGQGDSYIGSISEHILNEDFVGIVHTAHMTLSSSEETVTSSILNITASEVVENGLVAKLENLSYYNTEGLILEVNVSMGLISFHYNPEYEYRVITKNSIFIPFMETIEKKIPFDMIGPRLYLEYFGSSNLITRRWPIYDNNSSFIIVPIYNTPINGTKAGLKVEYRKGNSTKQLTIVNTISYLSVYGLSDYLIVPKVKGATQSDYIIISRGGSTALHPSGFAIYGMASHYRLIVDRISDVDYRIRELEELLNAT